MLRLLVLCFFHSLVSLCLQLKELNHDNVKPFVGACVEPGHICYLMQCCSRGTLQVSVHATGLCVKSNHQQCLFTGFKKYGV